MKFKLGYIGVGLMGGPMVKRLTSLGWSVRGYDIVPERSSVRSVAEAVQGADVVLLNLPTNDAVEDAISRLVPVLRAPSWWSTSPPFRSKPAARMPRAYSRRLAAAGSTPLCPAAHPPWQPAH